MNSTKRKRISAVIAGSTSLVSIPRCTCGQICERECTCTSCGKVNDYPKKQKDDRYIGKREFGEISQIAGI
jgi:hypothetical protein